MEGFFDQGDQPQGDVVDRSFLVAGAQTGYSLYQPTTRSTRFLRL